MPRHYLSVDLESAHHATNLQGRLRRHADVALKEQLRRRVVPATRSLLALFRKHDVKACFFVLAELAKDEPKLLDEVAADGHRIASHGLVHQSFCATDNEVLQQDLETARDVLRPWEEAWQGGLGLRAPNFSLRPEMYHMLRAAGFDWSSSLMRARLSPELADQLPAHAILALEKGEPFQLETDAGPVHEYPLAGRRLFGRIPLAWGGGFWLRILPFAWNLSHMRSWDKAGRSFQLYLHPWELDLDQPRVDLPLWRAYRQYGGMTRLGEKLDRVFAEFRFKPCGPECVVGKSEELC